MIMTVIVAVFGALVALLGLVGLVQPERFRSIFTALDSQTRFIMAIALRLAMGGVLWWLADELRHPHVMRVLAAIAIFAAVMLLIMGRERLDRLVGWWLSRPDGLLRTSALFAAAFGVYLVYVAI
jgi:ABC-type Fe3+-siderophore transport system permease subunit